MASCGHLSRMGTIRGKSNIAAARPLAIHPRSELGRNMAFPINHTFLDTNGIRMHVAQSGSGDLVILLHGWPELWYSWRHQMAALSAAGYHVVAPDQRGFGQSESPEPIEAFNILELTADIIGLVNALGEQRAVIVGHDWGAQVAAHCGLLRPDLFHAVALIAVPFLQRSKRGHPPTQFMKRIARDNQFYQLYFQEPGRAEQEFEQDVYLTLRKLLFSGSGDIALDQRPNYFFGKDQGLLDICVSPNELPQWLQEEDLRYFAAEFERSGFRGGLNWYRNIDKNWELTHFLIGATITQPALFIAGERDQTIVLYSNAYETLENNLPRLYKKILIPSAGHWVQQEKPVEVNKVLLDFLATLNY